ncbi:MAG TPA: endo alpha-1,4 polygalactosaminidase, partial [Thermoanaerobaculia bacterium]|nr:endo alpha-1,4 polygalactosaminidase [Thermoanaerobaculia bacterium]
DVVFRDGFESGDRSGWQVWRPPPCTTWQWQLTGTIDIAVDVAMFDVELCDAPGATIDLLHAAGRVVVCYFSAGSWEQWRPDAGDFPPEVLGNPLDPPFQDERWLDIRNLAVLGPILGARMDLAVAKGCDGVEPDNVDGYANDSGFPLTAGDQLVFNRWLAAAAHARGLSVGLKNDLEQIPQLVESFDWALDEQCWEYAECDLLEPFVARGRAVFGVEYVGDPAVFCPPLNAMGYSWLKKHLDLGPWRVDCRAP